MELHGLLISFVLLLPHENCQEFKVSQLQSQMEGVESSNVTLICTVSSETPLGPLRWYRGAGSERTHFYSGAPKGGDKNDPRVNWAVENTNANFSITIRDLRVSDTGKYYCEKYTKADENKPYASGPGVTLTVKEITIKQSQGSMDAVVGSDVTLLCLLSSPLLKGQVKWMKKMSNGQEHIYSSSPTGGENNDLQVIRTDAISTVNFSITIKSVQLNDSGTYYCEKSKDGDMNTPFKAKEGVQLNVKDTGSPIISVFMLSIAVGVPAAVLLIGIILCVVCKAQRKGDQNEEQKEPEQADALESNEGPQAAEEDPEDMEYVNRNPIYADGGKDKTRKGCHKSPETENRADYSESPVTTEPPEELYLNTTVPSTRKKLKKKVKDHVPQKNGKEGHGEEDSEDAKCVNRNPIYAGPGKNCPVTIEPSVELYLNTPVPNKRKKLKKKVKDRIPENSGMEGQGEEDSEDTKYTNRNPIYAGARKNNPATGRLAVDLFADSPICEQKKKKKKVQIQKPEKNHTELQETKTIEEDGADYISFDEPNDPPPALPSLIQEIQNVQLRRKTIKQSRRIQQSMLFY